MPAGTGKKTRSAKQLPVTRQVLAGLMLAYIRMEADDLGDLTEDEKQEFLAAGTWLIRMWVRLNSKGG